MKAKSIGLRRPKVSLILAIGLLFLISAIALRADFSSSGVVEADHTADLVMLSTTLHGGGSGVSLEEQQANAAGLTFDVVSPAQWGAMTSEDFSHYKAIVLADPHCGGVGSVSAAAANASTWGSAVNGNVIIIGTDNDWHAHGSTNPRRLLTKNGLEFAAAEAGKTGAFISLSCYYHGAALNTPVPMLDNAFGSPGDFTVRGVGCFNNAHIVATHPAFTGLTDAILSGWGCSVHEAFDGWPIDFEVLAIARNIGSSFTAPDGTVGTPYILARGESLTVISDIDLAPTSDTNPVGSSHALTATVTEDDGAGGFIPVVGTTVTFNVVSGPHTGTTGSSVTDASGEATFSYIGSALGSDLIEATFVDSAGRTQRSNRVTKIWEERQGFPDAGPDSFLSIAVFEVMPLGEPNILTPLLLDFNTQIGRSDPLTEDDPKPEEFERISSSLVGGDTVVTFPDGFGGVGRREVNTEITSLNLMDRGGNYSVKAGQPALDFFEGIGRPELFTPSLGQVESQDMDGTGAPATDFPADSFFNVYTVVETPMGTLFNKEPLLVESRGITSFPPVAFYAHKSITGAAVPLHSIADPDGPAVALLKRSVHGTRAEELVGVPESDPSFDDTAEEAATMKVEEDPIPPTPVGFPDEGPDSFLSIAVFEIMEMQGMTNILTPLLLDFSTQIGRSDPLTEDDPKPETSEDLTSQINGETVTVQFPDGFGGVGRREVNTEITSLNLMDRGGNYSVKAGQPALDFLNNLGSGDLFTPSMGQVESQDMDGMGAPITDFPADSFFNVYAVIDTPMGTLFNKDPLIVVSRGIKGFPPVAFYPHQSTTDNPVELFSVADPDGPAVALLKRSVHGTRAEELVGVPESDPSFDDTAKGDLEDELPSAPPPPLGDCSDLLISNYQTGPSDQQFVEVTNVGGDPINIDGCSLVTYNAFTELSIGEATVDISGTLQPGEGLRIGSAGASDVDIVIPDGSIPAGPGGIAVLDIPSPADGTPVGDVLPNDITGMVYLNNNTVFGISHLSTPEHNAIYDCIYGGSGTGPFSGPFDPVGVCLGGE